MIIIIRLIIEIVIAFFSRPQVGFPSFWSRFGRTVILASDRLGAWRKYDRAVCSARQQWSLVGFRIEDHSLGSCGGQLDSMLTDTSSMAKP